MFSCFTNWGRQLIGIVRAAMRQVSTILAAAGVGLRRGTFQRRKVPKVLQGDNPLVSPFYEK